MLSIGTALLVLAGIRSSQAAEINIASPSAYKNREGNGCFCGDSGPPYRYQQVFPAADFAALGNKPHWIVNFGARADQSVEGPHTAYLPDNDVRLSTTQRGPDDQSLTFDVNHGSDVMQVYSGPLNMVLDVAGPGPGPKGFYRADFPAAVTPFLYDPRQGNLLLDWIALQGESQKVLADQIPGTVVAAGNPSATQGFRGAAAIWQFTFVPVIIINGGFETSDTPTYTQINAGQNTIAPWVVGGHSVEVSDAVGNGFITGPAFEGGQYLDLNGLGRGQLTQSFATTPGLLYTVTFAYTNNYYNSSTPASATVRLFDALGDRLNQTITHTGAAAGNLKWNLFNGQFTALQYTTSLEFTSLTDTDGSSGGIMLDAVQIFEGVSLKIDSITRTGDGSVLLKALGFPNGVHRIQASVDLSVDGFIDIGSVTADAAGLFQFQDTRAGLTKSFYRVAFP